MGERCGSLIFNEAGKEWPWSAVPVWRGSRISQCGAGNHDPYGCMIGTGGWQIILPVADEGK